MFSGITLRGEANRENSVVLMLTEMGLILNLPVKTENLSNQMLAKLDKQDECCAAAEVHKHNTNCIYHLVRRSNASIGAGYRERVRISTESTEEEGFFNMKVFTWKKDKKDFSGLQANVTRTCYKCLYLYSSIVRMCYLALIDRCSTKVQRTGRLCRESGPPEHIKGFTLLINDGFMSQSSF